MNPDFSQVKAQIRKTLLSAEGASSLMVAAEGELFDPSDLEGWFRESFPEMHLYHAAQNVPMIRGTVLYELFVRQTCPEFLDPLLTSVSETFGAGDLLSGNHGIMTLEQRFTERSAEDLWLRQGIRIRFLAW